MACRAGQLMRGSDAAELSGPNSLQGSKDKPAPRL
jgi:hypothetical protein